MTTRFFSSAVAIKGTRFINTSSCTFVIRMTTRFFSSAVAMRGTRFCTFVMIRTISTRCTVSVVDTTPGSTHIGYTWIDTHCHSIAVNTDNQNQNNNNQKLLHGKTRRKKPDIKHKKLYSSLYTPLFTFPSTHDICMGTEVVVFSVTCLFHSYSSFTSCDQVSYYYYLHCHICSIENMYSLSAVS